MSISRRSMLAASGAALATTFLFPLHSLAARPLTINYKFDAPPYSYVNGNQTVGMLPALMQRILGHEMGFMLRHRAYPWKRAQRMVQEDSGDALCTIPTEARKKFMVFSSEPAMTTKAMVFYNETNPKSQQIRNARTFEDLIPFSVVDFKGDEWAQRVLPKEMKVSRVSGVPKVLKLLYENRHDVFIGSIPTPMDEHNLPGLKKPLACFPIQCSYTAAFHLGIRQNYAEAYEIVDRFSRIARRLRKSGEIADIVRANYIYNP